MKTTASVLCQVNADAMMAGKVNFVISVYHIQNVNMARVLFPGNAIVMSPGGELIVIKVSGLNAGKSWYFYRFLVRYLAPQNGGFRRAFWPFRISYARIFAY